jgi:hypothetical protein
MARRTSRALDAVDEATLVRFEEVQGETLVASEKIVAVQRLAQTGMGGQALLHRMAEVYAAADPVLLDDVRFFGDIAKIAAGEIIADTVAELRQL